MPSQIADQPWRLWCLLSVAAVVLGAFLRLLWSLDMEYKGDEAWTFAMTQEVGRSVPFPWLGMPTSHDVRHPGGSVWVFLLLAKVFGATTPEGLGLACQITNTVAILLLVVFAWRWVPAEEREIWLWAALLVAVNPLAMVLHRKIWPPSIMPIFTMFFLFAWHQRSRQRGAFFWGLIGALLGQIYPASLFLAAGFFLWTALFDRRSFAWRWWLTGSILGALLLLPWLHYALTEMAHHSISQRRWSHLVEGKFWLRWFTEPLGISLSYSLNKEFAEFLRCPILGGRPTYFVAGLHLLMVGVGLLVILRGLRGLGRQPRQWWSNWKGQGSATAFTNSAAMWGFGLVFTATLLPIHRHYMVITFPLMFLWVALACLQTPSIWGIRGRPLLATLCLAQFLVSLSFLGYIHSLHRPVQGEYGTPYRIQRQLNTIPVVSVTPEQK